MAKLLKQNEQIEGITFQKVDRWYIIALKLLFPITISFFVCVALFLVYLRNFQGLKKISLVQKFVVEGQKPFLSFPVMSGCEKYLGEMLDTMEITLRT